MNFLYRVLATVAAVRFIFRTTSKALLTAFVEFRRLLASAIDPDGSTVRQ